jgi:hypothetical protein
MLGLLNGFEAGILRKRGTGFVDFEGVGKIGEDFESEAIRGEEFFELDQFFAVARAENEEAGHAETNPEPSENGSRIWKW